jgi:hypothetical protein
VYRLLREDVQVDLLLPDMADLALQANILRIIHRSSRVHQEEDQEVQWVVKDKASFQDLVTTRHIHTTKEVVDHRDRVLRCNLSGDNKDLRCSHHSNKVADLPCSSNNSHRPMVNILRTTNSSNTRLDQVSLNSSSNNKDPTQLIIPLGTSKSLHD